MARCKYGKLKNPIGRRKCKKAPRGGYKPRRGGYRAKRGGGANPCCPKIFVKCDRGGTKASLGGLLDLIPGFKRSRTKSAAKSASVFMKAGPTYTERGLDVRAKRIMCTVRHGNVSRRVNVMDLKKAVNKIVAAQKARRCVPLIAKN